MSIFHIAGLALDLTDVDTTLGKLDALYAGLNQRLDTYAADANNTVLCRAGCSHCCKSGGFFAVTLVEALRLNRATAAIPQPYRDSVMIAARDILAHQSAIFAGVAGSLDQPGHRDEATFSARVSAVTRTHPTCPLLKDDLCSIYEGRPFLCRAYGYATDAYAVESAQTLVFRSLCVLYEGVHLRDYVRAKDLQSELAALSRSLTGGNDPGRFTLPEAILAREVPS